MNEQAQLNEAEESALAQLLIELAFMVPRGTDFGMGSKFSKVFVRYIEAVRENSRASTMNEPAIRALIAKWRNLAAQNHPHDDLPAGPVASTFESCADELEALLAAGEAAETPMPDDALSTAIAFCMFVQSRADVPEVVKGTARDVEEELRAASLSPAVPLHETRKPFKMTVSKEWIEKMAKAEEECGDVSVGGAGAVESIEVAALRRIALGNLDIHQAILIARSTLGDKL